MLAKTPPTLWSYLETGTGPGGTAFWTDLRIHIAAQKRTAIFREGYNDRIAYRAGAKDAFYRYIKDNPYRYVIRKMHPEFFGNTLDLKIGDTWLQLYGNFLLLDSPVKEYVQISSKPEKRRDLRSVSRLGARRYVSKGCLCRLLSARRSGNTGTRP